MPEITYGFGLSGRYKNFDVSFFMQGQERVSFFINPYDISPFANKRNAMQFIADNHWNPNNPVAQSFWPRLSASFNDNNNQWSTWWLRNGRFLRMKTAEIGYTLPKKIFRGMPVENARIYLVGQNLFNITKFELWDPEMGGNGFNYPLQRVYSLGLNISF